MTSSAHPVHPAPVRLHRDRLTVGLYGYFVVWGWILYSFNPSIPMLARELHVSNAAAGLHGTAFAVGAIIVARLTPRLVGRFGRRTTLVGAGLTVAVGVLVLVTGTNLVWTLTGVLILSTGGNGAISAAQAGLALHHGRASSAAVTEANGVGSSIGLLGPLAVGACVAVGWGWRPAVAVAVLLAVGAAVFVARLPADGVLESPTADSGTTRAAAEAEPPASPGDRGLAVATWCYLAAIVAAIAIENATTFWSTDLIVEQTGSGRGIATAATAGLVAGMSAIRFVVGPLSLRIAPARLLTAAFLLAIVGWLVLWTASSSAVALAGLFIAGLGYGAQYPLAVAILLSTARRSTDRAQGNATFAGGAAVGIAPFVLGALADAFGAHTAFVLVPALALVGAAAAIIGPIAARHGAAARAASLLAEL